MVARRLDCLNIQLASPLDLWSGRIARFDLLAETCENAACLNSGGSAPNWTKSAGPFN